jgi:hypothetical protein
MDERHEAMMTSAVHVTAAIHRLLTAVALLSAVGELDSAQAVHDVAESARAALLTIDKRAG